MRAIVCLIIFLLYPATVKAGVAVSIGIFYQKVNDSGFKYKDKYDTLKKPNSISVGYTTEINNFSVLVSTNRLFHKAIKRKILIENDTFLSKTDIKYDLVQVGYRKKRIMPGLFIANAKIKTTLMNIKKTDDIIIYGSSLTYFISKNVSTSLIYLAPIKKLNTGSGGGFSINYLF